MYAAAKIMFYNRGNSSKNNKTYPISDFRSLKDITMVVLYVAIARDIVHITSCAQHFDITWYDCSENVRDYSIAIPASTTQTLGIMMNRAPIDVHPVL